MSHVKYWELSNVLANISVAILRVNIDWQLRMDTTMFVETLDTSQYSMRLIAESQNFTLNTGHKNLRSRTINCSHVFILGQKILFSLLQRIELKYIHV
jgi:hypothetical protein